MRNLILRAVTFAAVLSYIIIPLVCWRTETHPVPCLALLLVPTAWLWLFSAANGSDALDKVFK